MAKTITTTVVMPAVNLSDLRQELIQTFIDLRAGNVSIGRAKELNKLASSAIDTAKVQIANEYVRTNIREIPNLN